MPNPLFNIYFLFTDGQLLKSRPPPSKEDVDKVYKDAEECIPRLIPESLKTIIGQEFVELRFLKLHRLLQQEIFVKHLAFTLLEEIVSVLIQKRSKVRVKPKVNLPAE
jgi:hypothetical protein